MSVTARFFIESLLRENSDRTNLLESLEQLIDICNVPSESLTNLTHNTLVILNILSDVSVFADVEPPIKFLKFIQAEANQYYSDDLSFGGRVEYKIKSKAKSIAAKAKHPLYLAIDGNREKLDPCELFLIKVVVLSGLKAVAASTNEQVALFQQLDLNNFCLLYNDNISSGTFHNQLENAFKLDNSSFKDSIILKILNRLKGAIPELSQNSKPQKKPDPKPNEPVDKKTLQDRRNRKPNKGIERPSPSEKVVRGVLKGKPGGIIYQPPGEVEPGDSGFDEAEEVDLLPQDKINGQPVSNDWARRAAKERRFRGIISAQFLRTDRKRLTDFQLEKLCDQGIRELESAENGIAAFAVLMTLSTGAEPLFWHDWIFSELPDDYPCIDIEKGIYYHDIVMEEKRWQPCSEQVNKLNNTQNIVALPLENRLLKYLRRFSIENNKTISEVLDRSGEELDQSATNWIKQVFSESSMWLTISRVRDYLFQNVMTRTLDEALASHICAQQAYKMSPANNYTAFKQSVLVNQYIASLPPVFNFKQNHFSNADPWIGSKLLIKKDYLKGFILSLKQIYEQKYSEIDKKSTPLQIFDCHNAFMDYLVFCSFIETSHRPVDDPFPRRVDFQETLNAVFITDKVVSDQNKTRLSFHGRCLKELIEIYEQHLHNLCFWFAHFKFDLEANILQSLLNPGLVVAAPFFFYLDESKSRIEFQSITKSKLNERMPCFALPWNFGRHLRSTRLRELGVPAEYIAADMGHIGPGEQPFGSYSVNKPEYMEKIMSPAVDLLSESLGLSSDLPPIPFKQRFLKVPKVHISSEYIRKLGFEKRQSKRQQKARNDREIISQVFNEFLNNKDPDLIDDEALTQALEKVYQLKPINLIKTLNTFNRAVSFFISKHSLELSPPNKLIELKKEPSVFDSNSPVLIDIGMYLRRRFFERQLLEPLPESNRNRIRQLITNLYFCLHLFSFISCKDMLERILIAASSKDYFWKDATLYVNFRHEGKVYRRITLDDISASLFAAIVETDKLSEYKKQFDLETIERHLEQGLWLEVLEERYYGYTFKYLALVAQELSKIFMPGFIVPVLSGTRKVASLKEPSYVRYQSGCKLENEFSLDQDETTQKQTRKHEAPIAFSPSESIDLKKEKSFRSSLIKTFKDPVFNKNRANLTEQLNKQIALKQKESQSLQISILLAKWLTDTINRPGFRVTRLRLSTIQKEFYYLASYATERLCKIDIFSASEEQLLEAYQNIVHVSDHNQKERKSALLNFQTYLTGHFQVESVASSDLEAIDSDNPFSIDANYLSENEYTVIYRKLLNSNDENAEELALIFCFYFRLGFRVSEVFKLSFKDLHFDRLDNSYIVQKFNHFKGLKTKASVRTAHFFGKLTEEEFKVLQDWYKRRRSQNLALTSNIWNVDSDYAKNLILESIYQVTGDYTFNLRALRHGVASHEVAFFNEAALLVGSYQSELESYPTEYLLHHFYSTAPSRRHLYLTARNLGHGGPSTSLFNYTHNYEELVEQHYQQSLPNIKRYGLYATIFRKSLPLLRQWVKRYEGHMGSAYKAMLQKMTISQQQYDVLKLDYCPNEPKQAGQLKGGVMSAFRKWFNVIEQLIEVDLGDLDVSDLTDYSAADILRKLEQLCMKVALNPWGFESLAQLKPVPVLQSKQDIRHLRQLQKFDWSLLDSIDEVTLTKAAHIWEKAGGTFCFEDVEEDRILVEFASKLKFKAHYLADKPGSLTESMNVLPGLSIEKFRGGLKKPISMTVHPSIIPSRPTLRFVDSNNKVVDGVVSLIFIVVLLRLEGEIEN